jgi:hypothetical protein
MAKAIVGAIEIGLGIPLLFVAPELGLALIFSGAGEELAYVADILQGNPALTASSKLPSAPREFVFGEVRKGGTFLYQSTTGHQLNQVIAWAAHSCQALVALYIDQRKLYLSEDNESPWGGGTGDGTTYSDDSDNQYSFNGNTAAWHTVGNLWSLSTGGAMWSAGMTAARAQYGDTASSFISTIVGVTVDSNLYCYGCIAAGTAGSSSAVFTGASTTAGTIITDGGVTWVCLGPAPGGYWFSQLNAQLTSQWLSDCLMMGICGTYLKLTYDSAVFNGPPQLRATLLGNNQIYDPRTSTYGYTNNAALCCAWMLCDTQFGFGAPFAAVYGGIFGEQLIAAANICDEQVLLASADEPGTALAWQPNWYYEFGNVFGYGGTTYTVNTNYESGAYFGYDDYPNITEDAPGGQTESRYALNGYGNSNQLPGEILSSMLMAMEGRVTRQGGGYLIYPAAWYGTSLIFGQNDLNGGVQWNPSRKVRDRVNCVRATFVCPQYPYNQIGYDYDHKNTDIFEGEWQPTDAPPYAQDYLHGYGGIADPGQGDANLVQDGNVRLYADRRYQFVISVAQTQRLMKIYLLRNRFAGSGTFPMQLSALQAQCQDVINFTFAALNMNETYLEVAKFDWIWKESETDSGGSGARAVSVSTSLDLQLTDPSVYEWSTDEEMTLYDQQSPTIDNAFQVTPPSGFSATSNLSTAIVAPDGQVTVRIRLAWTEPADPFVTSGGTIQIQMTPHGTGIWASQPAVAGTAQIAYLSDVVSGLSYDLRIRSVRASGAYSVWVEVDNVLVGIVVSSTGLTDVAPPGTLTAVTTSSTVSAIAIANFTAALPGGGFTVACMPSPSTLAAVPQTLYYVYYIDPSFAGGAITPIATANINDFLAKPGYFLIGSILTPPYVSGGSGGRFYPSNWVNLGQTTPSMPTAAYDGNLGTAANIGSMYSGGAGYYGEVLYEDFPSVTSYSGMNLWCNLSVGEPAGAVNWAVTACIGGGARASGNFYPNPRGSWTATTAYAAGDLFNQSGVNYLCVTAYTSGATFGATDLAKCCYVLAYGTGALSSTTVSVPIPTATPLSGVTVDVIANQGTAAGPPPTIAVVAIFEVWAS